jgi:hypothetical protein
VGDYDTTQALVIDPTLTWNTFLGTGGAFENDYGQSIAVDSSGNVYVAGHSNATWGSPVRAYSGSGYDVFVAKLDNSGNLVWNTFLGGSGGEDQGFGIAVDGSGNVYVTGWSAATWRSPVRSFSGGNADAFAAKLSSSGSLTWNTFFGSSGGSGSYGPGVAVDGSGNVHLVGHSNATWGSPWRAFGGGSYDAFAVKLNSSGSLASNGFLGGFGSDYGYGIATDGGGNVYVVGSSSATWGSPPRPYGASDDAFVAKLAQNQPTIASAANQTFFVGDSPRAISPMTVTDDVSSPVITGANDIRIRIPAGFNMTWDTSDTTAVIGGGASSKVSTTVSYEDSGKTLVLNVTTDFASGDTITVSDLRFTSFTAPSAADNLELEVYNDGGVTAVDDKTIRVVLDIGIDCDFSTWTDGDGTEEIIDDDGGQDDFNPHEEDITTVPCASEGCIGRERSSPGAGRVCDGQRGVPAGGFLSWGGGETRRDL